MTQIRELNPERILISPGPCSPRESGLSNDIIRAFGPRVPLFGVCLGHQCIGHTFGGEVVVNYRMMHGKTSPIKHNGRDLFRGMPNPFAATRYHSLVIKRDSMPDCLEITAETAEGEIMGVRHKSYPIWGVQFHPESILTENGAPNPEKLSSPSDGSIVQSAMAPCQRKRRLGSPKQSARNCAESSGFACGSEASRLGGPEARVQGRLADGASERTGSIAGAGLGFQLFPKLSELS